MTPPLRRSDKRNADQRWTLCPDLHCQGQVAPVLESSNKEPVFLCHHCGKTFSRTAVAQAHRLRVARERQAGRTS